MSYHLGAIPSPPDVRDYTVRTIRGTYPRELLLDIPKHYDQKANTCVPQTLRLIYQLAYGVDFGVNYVYAGGRSGTYYGMYPAEAMNFLVKAGDARLADDPYELEVPEAIAYYNQHKGEIGPKAAFYDGCIWAAARSEAQIKEALCAVHKLAEGEHLPVSVTLGVESYDPDSRGVWRCREGRLGYHQVLVKGWKVVDGKEMAVIHNSWGTGWGKKGDAYVPWEDVTILGGYVVIPKAVEQMEESPIIRRTLRLKTPYMRDDGGYTDVRECQDKLTAHGFPCGTPDGIFGAKADKAARTFQQARGLTVDGIVGAKTWAALDEEPEETQPIPLEEEKQQLLPEPESLAAGLVQYVLAHLEDIYVWGGNGQTGITQDWIQSMDTSSANAQRSIKYWQNQQAAGVTDIAAYDCSGLISRYLQDLGLVSAKRNCDHLWAMCRPIQRQDLAPGDLLFRTKNGNDRYHVGVYVGKGRVVEAKGRDDGVIIRGIDAAKGYWDEFGRLEV